MPDEFSDQVFFFICLLLLTVKMQWCMVNAALELLRPGFLSQLPDSISHV